MHGGREKFAALMESRAHFLSHKNSEVETDPINGDLDLREDISSFRIKSIYRITV